MGGAGWALPSQAGAAATRRRGRLPPQLGRARALLVRFAHVQQRAEAPDLHLSGAESLVAAAPARGQQAALGLDRRARAGIIDGRQQRARVRVIGAALDGQRALCRGRRAQGQRQHHARQPIEQPAQHRARADGLVLGKPCQAGKGEHDAIERPFTAARFAQAPQPGVDVAAQFAHRDAWCAGACTPRQRALQERGHEGLAPGRRTADAQAPAAGQLLVHVGRKYHDIARILALRHGRQLQTRPGRSRLRSL